MQILKWYCTDTVPAKCIYTFSPKNRGHWLIDTPKSIILTGHMSTKYSLQSNLHQLSHLVSSCTPPILSFPSFLEDGPMLFAYASSHDWSERRSQSTSWTSPQIVFPEKPLEIRLVKIRLVKIEIMWNPPPGDRAFLEGSIKELWYK